MNPILRFISCYLARCESNFIDVSDILAVVALRQANKRCRYFPEWLEKHGRVMNGEGQA